MIPGLSGVLNPIFGEHVKKSKKTEVTTSEEDNDPDDEENRDSGGSRESRADSSNDNEPTKSPEDELTKPPRNLPKGSTEEGQFLILGGCNIKLPLGANLVGERNERGIELRGTVFPISVDLGEDNTCMKVEHTISKEIRVIPPHSIVQPSGVVCVVSGQGVVVKRIELDGTNSNADGDCVKIGDTGPIDPKKTTDSAPIDPKKTTAAAPVTASNVKDAKKTIDNTVEESDLTDDDLKEGQANRPADSKQRISPTGGALEDSDAPSDTKADVPGVRTKRAPQALPVPPPNPNPACPSEDMNLKNLQRRNPPQCSNEVGNWMRCEAREGTNTVNLRSSFSLNIESVPLGELCRTPFAEFWRLVEWPGDVKKYLPFEFVANTTEEWERGDFLIRHSYDRAIILNRYGGEVTVDEDGFVELPHLEAKPWPQGTKILHGWGFCYGSQIPERERTVSMSSAVFSDVFQGVKRSIKTNLEAGI